MPAQAGFPTLSKHAAGVAVVITMMAANLSVRAAEPAGNNPPRKPIIRHLKLQTPLPAYGKPNGSTTGVERSGAARAGAIDRLAKQRRTTSAGSAPPSQPGGRPPSWSTTIAPETRPTARLKVPLSGSVVINVPKTPEDVAAYLTHMQSIIRDYERVAVDTLLAGGSININPATIETSRGQSLELIRRIRTTTPPAELTVAHNQLAETMAAVGDFLERPGGAVGGGLAALTQLQPLLGRLHSSLDRYHTGVSNCIAFYGLSPDLDPFNSEDQDAKQRLTGALRGMTGSLINPPSASAPSAGKSAHGSLPDFGAGGGGIDLNALKGLMGGVDLGALTGGSGNADAGALGAAGGLDFSKLGNLDSKSLGNSGGQELDILKQFIGPAGEAGSSPSGLQLDGQSADMLINALKQLQGQ